MTEPSLRERVRDAVSGWPIGSGYYQTAIHFDEAQEIADAVLAVVRDALPDPGWNECLDKIEGSLP